MSANCNWLKREPPFSMANGYPRSEEKAIHFPSGDQGGGQSPRGPLVRGLALLVLISRIHKSAVPAARGLTKTIRLPSGDQAAWSSNAGLSVNRSRSVPAGATRYRSAEPFRSELKTIHWPSADHAGL